MTRPKPSPRAAKRPGSLSVESPTPARGRHEIRRTTTRRELVLAGRHLFGSAGIYESRIEDITERAGIAKGTLYLHFDSKEHLLEAVTDAGLSELQACVRERLALHRTLPGVLEAMLRAHLEFYVRNPDLMRILYQVRGALKFDQPAWRPLRKLLRRHMEFLADCLTMTEARTWPAPRRLFVATLVYGTASGVSSVHASIFPELQNLARAESAWVGRLSKTLAVGGGSAAARVTRRSSRGRGSADAG